MASKKEVKEVDYVSKQANLTAQVESERQAAKKWWDEYGMVYLDDAKPEDFTYDNRIQVLKNKLAGDKYAQSDPV
jgi:signal recognition particle subunit SEC65